MKVFQAPGTYSKLAGVHHGEPVPGDGFRFCSPSQSLSKTAENGQRDNTQAYTNFSGTSYGCIRLETKPVIRFIECSAFSVQGGQKIIEGTCQECELTVAVLY